MMRRAVAAFAMLLCLAQSAAAQQPVRAQVSVAPDTVTVGDPITVTVQITAPRSEAVQFGAGPDSTAWVRSLDPKHVEATPQGDSVRYVATYRVAAWNVGALPIAVQDVQVRTPAGVQRVPLTGISVFVRSVLPSEKSARVPRGPRGIFTDGVFPWWILIVAAALLLVAWMVWRYRKRRRRGADAASAYQRAEREFARIAALGLVEAGERGRHVTLMVQVVRTYLAARYPLAECSRTSRELLRELAEAEHVPHEQLAALLAEADLVKFARHHLTKDRALALGAAARDVVEAEHLAAQQMAASPVAAGATDAQEAA